MNILIAIDSFKGSLSTFQAGQAVSNGIRRVYPNADIRISPLADGGEGTVNALISCGGKMVSTHVKGPLGEKIKCEYGILNDSKTAVMEISSVAGITLVPEEKRNPLHTTTYGVGELILDAISKGCREFIIGIGGSATNDGGVGMLQALGFAFLSENGNSVSYGAKGLEKIYAIETQNSLPILKQCRFRIACDVNNPLCGNTGCSHIYGPQKGANEEMVENMDAWMLRFATLTKSVIPDADPDYPGAGSAGGLGFAFMTYLNAELSPGVDLIIKKTKLEKEIKKADIVITGEGKLDGQTKMGKAPIGVAKLAKKYNKPVIAFSGSVTPEAVACNNAGIDAYFPVLRSICTQDEAMDITNASQNVADTTEQVFRLISCMQ